MGPQPRLLAGHPRELDPQTGEILGQAEPWRVKVRAPLPFDPEDVMFVTGYFVDGHFMVTDPDSDVSYLESPLEFGSRLQREAAAAVAAGLTGHLSRAVVLLTDNEPVPQWAARQVAGGLRDYQVITVSMPATMFLDDHPGAGIIESRVALLPGSSEADPPVWTRTSPAGIPAELTAAAPSLSGGRSARTVTAAAPVPVPGPAVPIDLDLARPRDLMAVRQILQAGTGLTPWPLRSGRPNTGASVVAVRRALGIDFVSGLNRERHPSPIESLQVDGVFELLGDQRRIRPGQPAADAPGHRAVPAVRLAHAPGQPPSTAVRHRDKPLYVFADYYGRAVSARRQVRCQRDHHDAS